MSSETRRREPEPEPEPEPEQPGQLSFELADVRTWATVTFLAAYGRRLRKAEPAQDGWTVFPFTRTFVVVTKS